jgi:hypothetical protein
LAKPKVLRKDPPGNTLPKNPAVRRSEPLQAAWGKIHSQRVIVGTSFVEYFVVYERDKQLNSGDFVERKQGFKERYKR